MSGWVFMLLSEWRETVILASKSKWRQIMTGVTIMSRLIVLKTELEHTELMLLMFPFMLMLSLVMSLISLKLASLCPLNLELEESSFMFLCRHLIKHLLLLLHFICIYILSGTLVFPLTS